MNCTPSTVHWWGQQNSSNGRLILSRCSTECLQRPFVPSPIQAFNLSKAHYTQTGLPMFCTLTMHFRIAMLQFWIHIAWCYQSLVPIVDVEHKSETCVDVGTGIELIQYVIGVFNWALSILNVSLMSPRLQKAQQWIFNHPLLSQPSLHLVHFGAQLGSFLFNQSQSLHLSAASDDALMVWSKAFSSCMSHALHPPWLC